MNKLEGVNKYCDKVNIEILSNKYIGCCEYADKNSIIVPINDFLKWAYKNKKDDYLAIIGENND